MLHTRLDRLSIKLLPLEHRIWRELKSYGVVHKNLIIAVSGGLDSVVLATLLSRLSPMHKCKITLAHVHHGGSPSKQQLLFREKSVKFVKKLARDFDSPFVTNKISLKRKLSSEAEWRELRYKHLQKWAKKKDALIALAHHADDLFETQLLRMIRGVGAQGLQSMQFLSESKLRPLLRVRRSEIEAYAKKLGLDWLEDPSNKKNDPLRNWLRQHWLKDLEKKSPGAGVAMMRSFSLLSDAILSNAKTNSPFQNGTIERKKYLALSRVEQCALIAHYLKSLDIKNYSHGHVEEIRRRLDNSRGDYTFTLLKHVWQVNAERIQTVII